MGKDNEMTDESEVPPVRKMDDGELISAVSGDVEIRTEIMRRLGLRRYVYDRNRIVFRSSQLLAGGMKLAAYQVRDIETDELSSLQFHMTYNNTVLAVMGEEAAKLFATFVNAAIDGQAKETSE